MVHPAHSRGRSTVRDGAVALVFGTRPELVKLAPLVHELGDRCITVHTGQHAWDRLAPIARDLGLGAPTVTATVPSHPVPEQLGSAITAVGDALVHLTPEVVVVQGDTNSTVAGALAASGLGLPLAHVEAGLRAFDRALPEERNRIVVDHLADLLYAPTDTARAHLLDEGCDPATVTVTGNTVVDAVVATRPGAAATAAVLDRFDVAADGFVLATFHRQENVDEPDRLAAIVTQLATIPLPVVLAVHPRTRDRAARAGIDLARGVVRAVDPLGFRDFLALESACAFLVSDSGGVQEEASIVGRPVLVARRSTERPEVIGTFATLVDPAGGIAPAAAELAADVAGAHRRLAGHPSPFGDGHAAARIVADLDARLAGDGGPTRRYDAARGRRDASVPSG
jgi:UDP-N-acetylglucosamine 2-epimerase (non-hydrolysing)